MPTRVSRRDFVKAGALTAAAAPLSLHGVETLAPPASALPLAPRKGTLPAGRIAGVELSRVILGGNLLGGYAHARGLDYVSHLMKHYNTPAKIAETLELAEIHGINAINTHVSEGTDFLEAHWKRGGKMKWIAQASAVTDDVLSEFKKAVDLGASAVHLQGHSAENLLHADEMDNVLKIVDYLKSRKVAAGVAAHAHSVIVECVKAKVPADFYQKTLHTHDYHTAPRPGEKGDLGRYDNSWCRDPEEVAEFMFTVPQPWIAFKVLAAGGIPPRQGLQYAFDSGADFVLLGMFDWQVAEDVEITREVLANLNRKRPWRG